MSCIYSGLPLCIDTEDITTRPSMSTTTVQNANDASHLTSDASSAHCVVFLEKVLHFLIVLEVHMVMTDFICCHALGCYVYGILVANIGV